MGRFVNNIWLNIIGFVVVLIVTFLGLYSLVDAITSFLS